MKKMMVALLLLVAVSGVASAQVPFIGIFAEDTAPQTCFVDVATYVTTSAYVFAVLPPEVTLITAAEFRIDNLPDASLAITTPIWNTPLVIGDAGYGIALAFTPALAGPNAFLGQLDFFALADFGPDFRMTVMASLDSDKLVVVDDLYEEVVAEGGFFTFNCIGGLPGGCDCEEGIAADDANWGSIKALY